MAKLFPIGIEVEEIAVGKVLRILNSTPGVAKLHLNLMNESASAPTIESQNQEIQNVLPPVRQPKEGSSQMVAAEVLRVTPAHNNILREALKRKGYSEASLPALLTRMRALGFVKKVGVGTWRLTDKGSRHYFSAGTKQLPPRTSKGSGPATNNGYGVRKLVLTSLNNGAQLLARDLRRILEEHEYSPKNMTGTVSKMKQEGLVKTDSVGTYSLTEQGIATLNEIAASPMENKLEN
jgi:Mn-dependent DtxR family transcriptional regulator